MGSQGSARAGAFTVAAGLAGLLGVATAPVALAAGEPPADPGGQGQATAAEAPAEQGTTASAEGQATAAEARDEHQPSEAPPEEPSTGPELADERGAGDPTASSTGSASDQGNTPPGNNGTIKIHEVGTDREDTRNEPHVACEFLVEFYGYDGGAQSVTDMAFELWSPTSGGTYRTSSPMHDKPETRTSGNQWDFEMAFRADDVLVDAGAPHEQQGYHVKLTVHVTGSQGSDVKHKVFWLSPCPETTTEVASTVVTTTTTTTTTTDVVAASSVLGTSFVAPTPAPSSAPAPVPAEVGGVHDAQQPAAASLARTGLAAAGLAGLGGALLATGTALARSSRRNDS